MTWRPVDCHAHSTFSDGALTVAEIAERGRARGVRPSVADHISRDVAKTIGSVTRARQYLDELERFDVFRGGEFCWHDALWRELPDDVVSRFTHRIGSLHAIHLPNGTLVRAFSRRLPQDLTPSAYMDAHVAEAERFAREMPVDILAHPTLITLPFRGHELDDLWTEEREQRLVEALFHARIAFEISNRYRPHERIVARAIARGVRLSLGSDGHTKEQVGSIEWPLALARRLGVADRDLYDPATHGCRVPDRSARP
ncbi:MAG TPA: hypothetical protein VF159_11400 [Gemmatimonadaceae bacterium]